MENYEDTDAQPYRCYIDAANPQTPSMYSRRAAGTSSL